MEKCVALILAAACLTWYGCRKEEAENGSKPAAARSGEDSAKGRSNASAEKPESGKAPSPAEPANRRDNEEPATKPTSEPAVPKEAKASRSPDKTDEAKKNDGSSPGETAAVAGPEGTTRNAIKLSPEVLDRYVGYYQMRPGLFLHVTRVESQLFVQVTGRDMYPVYAEDETRFFYAATAADIVFAVDESGAAESLTLETAAGDQVARKLPPEFTPPAPKVEVPVDASILQRYVGKYEIRDNKHVEITFEDGNLYAQITDQPRFEIYPSSETRFFYKVFDVEISFVVKPDGEVIALTIHEGERQSVAKKLE